MRKSIPLLILFALLFGVFSLNGPSATAQSPNYKLSIIHSSETHGRWEPETVGGVQFGGIARRATLVKKLRAENPNTLLLDSGDVGQGTLYFIQYKGAESRDFYNMLGYDAVSPGNHDGDWGAQTMADNFVKGAKFSLVTANVDYSNEPALAGKIQPYVIKTVGGEKIGIFGMITDDILINSAVGRNLKLKPAVETANAMVAELTRQGVNKIIMLSHRGFDEDLKLAGKVNGIDVIVSGHTATLLGDASKLDKALGSPLSAYPVSVSSPDGSRTLIVHAYQYDYLLGKLDVTFNDKGEVVNWGGDPIMLTKDVAEDPDVASKVAELGKPFADFKKQVVGKTAVDLNGERNDVRFKETNLGDLVADAMLWKTADDKTQVALVNGGGIRTSIKAGDVTQEQVLTVLPFANFIVQFDLTGADLLKALENGMSQAHDTTLSGGRFAQVAGVRFKVDLKKPVGQRVFAAEVGNSKDGFKPLDPSLTYRVATVDFEWQGGDGYAVFANGKNVRGGVVQLDQALTDYLKAFSPVSPKVEGRVTFETAPAVQATATAPAAQPALTPTLAATATSAPPTPAATPATLPTTGGDAPAPLVLYAALGLLLLGGAFLLFQTKRA